MKFNWENYKHLGHDFKIFFSSITDNGWHKCNICNVFVYVDLNSNFKDKLMCWPSDLFHNNLNINNEPVLEFNFSCAEMIIKNIIE